MIEMVYIATSIADRLDIVAENLRTVADDVGAMGLPGVDMADVYKTVATYQESARRWRVVAETARNKISGLPS